MVPRVIQFRWFSENRTILSNTASLVGSSAAVSGLGFVFWWAAARLFPASVVGLASAALSSMLLLGTMGMLGLGTLLIGELPLQPTQAGSLITTALLIVGAVSTLLGFLFAIAVPYFSPEFQSFLHGFVNVAFFATGVVLTAVTMVLDKALLGLLRGDLQLRRNVLFSVAKLLALLGVGLWLTNKSAMTVYLAWLLGNLASLLFISVTVALRNVKLIYRPQWYLLKHLRYKAAKHYALDLGILAPGLLLPLLVTSLLSATLNASFYAAWMVVNFTFVIPHHLSTVLFAVSAADSSGLARKLRFTLLLSLAIGVPACAVLLAGAHPVLTLFGSTYAEQAAWSLRILALGIFPIIIKTHYIAISRVYNRVGRAASVIAVGGALELALAALGAKVAGLTGLSLGLVVAFCVEAIFTAPTVYQAATAIKVSSGVASRAEQVQQ